MSNISNGETNMKREVRYRRSRGKRVVRCGDHWQVIHGSFCMLTPFEVVQHKYGHTHIETEGRHGYVEVLEFVDPPEGRPKVVLYNQRDHVTYDFDSVKAALNGWKVFVFWKRLRTCLHVSKLSGCTRVYALPADVSPWFYPEELNPSA